MSIDKESNGLPQIDPHRSTTKVNFGVIAGVLVFLFLAVGGIIWLAARNN
ncbi:hypothetical protein [Opitutus sp. ER46]|nr:hypothetical protein [Opitutus sp. ER46]